MKAILLVFLGGGLGSLARYGISLLVKTGVQGVFPLATLLSNIISCIVLALLAGSLAHRVADKPGLVLFMVVGFCGGFSTFSTFSFETIELIRNGHTAYALANVAVSVIACLGVIYLLVKPASV
ncbi:MAG: fluoride efflux transporter CrcB [Bacteroidota bacterium]